MAEPEEQGEGDKPGEQDGQRRSKFRPQKDTSYPGTTKIDKWHYFAFLVSDSNQLFNLLVGIDTYAFYLG
jgi:hypothetical protein